MFSFQVSHSTFPEIVQQMIKITQHPHYEQLTTSSVQYSEETLECTYHYIYKIESFKWLWHLITPNIYKEIVSVRNICAFDFVNKKIDFVIEPRNKKYYQIKGKIQCFHSTQLSMVVFITIHTIHFKDVLKKLPKNILAQIESYIKKQIETDFQIIISHSTIKK